MIVIRYEINIARVEQPPRLLNVGIEFGKSLPSRMATWFGF